MTRRLARVTALGGVMLVALVGFPIGCSRPTTRTESAVDRELARTSSAARAAFERGLLQQASALYRLALQRARAMDDPNEIGNAAYNRAVCLVALGQYERAQEHLSEARAAFLRAGADIADVLLVEAKTARLQGDYDRAMDLTDELLSRVQSSPSTYYPVEIHLLRGHIACDRADSAAGRAHLESANRLLGSATDPSLQAGVSHLAGRIDSLQGRPREAAREFDRESVLLQGQRRYRQMAYALARAGRAHAQAEQWRLAADRLLRAARSALSHGERSQSLELCKEAIFAAEKAGDAEIAKRTEAFLAEIEPSPRAVDDVGGP